MTNVLRALSRVGLHLKPEKCEFHKAEVEYLGLIIRKGGVKMDTENIEAVQDSLVKLSVSWELVVRYRPMSDWETRTKGPGAHLHQLLAGENPVPRTRRASEYI